MKITRNIIQCFVTIIVFGLVLGIQEIIIAKDRNFKDIQILEEEVLTYNIDEILSSKILPFKKFESTAFKLIKKSYWIRFTYHKSENQKTYFLHSPFILYQKIDLFYSQKDRLYHYESGVAMNFKKRNLFAPDLYLELPPGNQPTVCYLHINGFFYYSFFFSEKDIATIIEDEIKQSSFVYFFIGINLVSVLFSIIFFAFLKDNIYIYYALFSIMLIFSRLTHSGFIFNYISDIYYFNSLKSIYNLYAIGYAGINIALILYFHEYLKFEKRSKKYYWIIYSILIFRIISLLLQINSSNELMNKTLNSYFIDLFIQVFFTILCIRTSKNHYIPSMLTLATLVIIMMGNLMFILNDFGILKLNLNLNIFLDFAGFEVIIFAISIGYKNFYLKKEHDKAVELVIKNIKESEQLKDNLNKELEIQVAQRTQKIEEMNALLNSHNIQLTSEVVIAKEALIFQKNLSFDEFKKTFPDDDSCYGYLAKLKWKAKDSIKCKKCGYEKYKEIGNYTIRCGKCNHVESVINGTLFQGIRFSILKAFYITYFTSTSKQNLSTVEALSKELELRPATLWTFKQKVLALMEINKTKKKNKDSWTHLIEYSIK